MDSGLGGMTAGLWTGQWGGVPQCAWTGIPPHTKNKETVAPVATWRNAEDVTQNERRQTQEDTGSTYRRNHVRF